jgi:O-acetyl-ADP-ribose deacetylase
MATVSRPFGTGRIELVQGNIVNEEVDAIVNAANTELAGGGGVDGAIHRAAGPALILECRAIAPDQNGQRCPTGEARVTGAGNLKVKYVIHTAGPVYNDQSAEKAEQQLRSAYRNSLQAAADRQCKTVALPSISTGAYGFPIERAAAIALRTTAEFLGEKSSLEVVRFVLFDGSQFNVFSRTLNTGFELGLDISEWQA